MWIKIILVAEIFFTVGQVCSDSTYLSKACYGAPGPRCTRHELNCTKHAKIAIEDAFFTMDQHDICPTVGINTCTNYSNDKADNSVYSRFNSTQLDLLYKNCSAKRNCIYKAPRMHIPPIKTFTIVKYQCIEDHSTVRICNGTPITGCDISARLKTACTCLITREKPVPSGRLDFYLLDMSSTTTHCNKLSINIGGEELIYNCTSPFTSYMHLVNGIHQTNDNTSIAIYRRKVWIQIKDATSFVHIWKLTAPAQFPGSNGRKQTTHVSTDCRDMSSLQLVHAGQCSSRGDWNPEIIPCQDRGT